MAFFAWSALSAKTRLNTDGMNDRWQMTEKWKEESNEIVWPSMNQRDGTKIFSDEM